MARSYLLEKKVISTKLFARCLIGFLLAILTLLYISSEAIQSLRAKIRSMANYRNTYTFSVDYFAGNADNWRSYLKGYEGRPGVQYLEIGVFEGSSSCGYWKIF